jgi:cell division protein FtsL
VSVPARKVDTDPAPLHRPSSTQRRPASPARTAAARPRTSIPPQGIRRARRGLHPRFLIFASSVIIALVVSVVALNALFAQTAFAVHAMQTQVTDLGEQHDVLAMKAAQLSSPSRIATWAEYSQMVLPENVVILRVPRLGRTATP